MSINPFDPPPLIKTPPTSASSAFSPRPLPPLPKGREIRVPVFDDGERPASNAKA